MKILPDVKIIDLFLFLEKNKILVIGDAHLGYEESLTKQGVLLPKFQFKEIMERVTNILEETKPDKIIVVGDLKHEFGRISKEEWNDTLEFLDLLLKYSEVIIIRGNHDTFLEPIIKKKSLGMVDYFVIEDYYFCHGHQVPEDKYFKKAKVLIIGHEHPAVGLREGPRIEIYKCFLKGKYKSKDLVVLPSLSSLPEGTDVTKEKLLSPLIENIGSFEAFILGDKIYNFGKIKDIS